MLFEAPRSQAKLLVPDVEVISPATEEPTSPPTLRELAVAAPLVVPGGAEEMGGGGEE